MAVVSAGGAGDPAVGATGLGAGFGANALFSGQELFANNRIEAGELDLKVDWEVDYFNGLDPDPVTISDSDIDGDGDLELVDDPGPIVDLQDVKPGDVIQHTLSLHLFGNPGFITMDGLLTADSDNGFTEPEDQVDGALNDSDGTPDGDLDNHLQCVVWFDDGDGLPQEIWSATFPQTEEEFIDDLRISLSGGTRILVSSREVSHVPAVLLCRIDCTVACGRSGTDGQPA